MTFVVMVIVIIVIVVMMLMMMRVFDFLNPSRRSSGAVEVKEVGIEQFVEVHVAVVRLDDLRLRLDSPNDGLDMRQLVGCNLCGFVEQNEIAELDLLDNQRLQIFLFRHIMCQRVTAAKLVS